MSKKAKVKVEEDVSCNLIPMIDIMFLLLLFFMLGADMGQRELEEVRLPVASSVKEDKGAVKDKLTVNVYHVYDNVVKCKPYADGDICVDETHWIIGVRGNPFTYWWVYIPPTLALIFFGVGWNLLGDGLNRALNPRLHR